MSGLIELQARAIGELLAILKKEIADAVADGVRRAVTELGQSAVPDAPSPSSRERVAQVPAPVAVKAGVIDGGKSAPPAQTAQPSPQPPQPAPAPKPRKNPARFCAECRRPIGAFSKWCRDCYRGGAPKTREVVATTKPHAAPAPTASTPSDPFPVTVTVKAPPKIAPYVPQRADAPPVTMPPAPAIEVEPAIQRTAEREDRLRRGLAAGDGTGLILAILNSYPGPKLLPAELNAWIAEIGAQCPGQTPPPDGRTKHTAGRRNVLIAAYENGDPVANIRQKLNMMAGPMLDNVEVQRWADELGLRRPLSYSGGGVDPEKESPMDWNSALSWAVRHRLKFPRGGTPAEHAHVINEKRAVMGLWPWRITNPRSRRRAIPAQYLFSAPDRVDTHTDAAE